MKILVFCKDEVSFNDFRLHQFKPEECVWARDEVAVLQQCAYKDICVVMLPGWATNPEYSRIRNLQQLIVKVRSRK